MFPVFNYFLLSWEKIEGRIDIKSYEIVVKVRGKDRLKVHK